jgi:hypothetical protein
MVGDVCCVSFVGCCLFQFKNSGLGQGFCYFSVSYFFFVPHFVVSAWRLKCTKHMGCNSDVVQ